MHKFERSPVKKQWSGSLLTPRRWLPVVVGWSLAVNCWQAAYAAQPAFDCFPASDLERVFEDGYGLLEPRAGSLHLFGLRNETISGQCALLARDDVQGLTFSVGPLQRMEGSDIIPQENLTSNFVGGIFIEKNSPNRQPETLLRPAPAWFPDVLTDERTCSLKQGMRKAVYITIRIPPEAPPGDYQATLTASAGSARATLPLTLRVYPLTLPNERHVLVTEWFSTSRFKQHHGVDPSDPERFSRMLGVYARNMAEHRQNVFRVGLDAIESRRAADGKLEFDFSRFDKLAQVFWDTGRMDALETGFIARFGLGGWSGNEILLDEFRVKGADGRRVSVSGKDFLPQFLPAFVGHLRAKGWLGKTLFHICDEPSDHNVMAFRAASDFLDGLAPELRRMDAIETPHCLGALEVWVPKLDHLATWHEAYEDAQRQGNELWFYTVGIFQGGSC